MKVKVVAATKVKLTIDRMALLRYLQVLPRCGQLPDPTGPLSSSLPSSAIDEAKRLVLVKKRLRRQREGLIVATNATLFLHTSLSPPSDLRFAKWSVERVKLKFNALEFNFAQSRVRENKSAEIFPQYYTSSFGEIFPWRKFPAIR